MNSTVYQLGLGIGVWLQRWILWGQTSKHVNDSLAIWRQLLPLSVNHFAEPGLNAGGA